MSKLGSIQVGRALAALSVVTGHVLHEAGNLRDAQDWLLSLRGIYPFGSGVDVFFVISGFIMCYISRGRMADPGYAGRFVFNRVTRVVPLYWFYTSLMVALLLIMPGAFDSATFDLGHVLASYLFFPGIDDTYAQPIFALGWTLNYEMFFYALFALVILGARRAAPVVAILLLLSIFLAHPALSGGPYFLEFWSRGLILEFAAGMGLALLPWGRIPRSPVLAGLLLAGAVALLFWMHHYSGLPLADWRWLRYGLPAVVFVTGLLLLARDEADPEHEGSWPRRTAVLLGDASYSLYLSHPFVLSAVYMAWARLAPGPAWAYVVVAVLACLAFSILSYRWLELPLARIFRSLGGRRSVPARSAS